MRVEFLSAEQCRRYGRFGGEPTPAQLGRFFQEAHGRQLHGHAEAVVIPTASGDEIEVGLVQVSRVVARLRPPGGLFLMAGQRVRLSLSMEVAASR